MFTRITALLIATTFLSAAAWAAADDCEWRHAMARERAQERREAARERREFARERADVRRDMYQMRQDIRREQRDLAREMRTGASPGVNGGKIVIGRSDSV